MISLPSVLVIRPALPRSDAVGVRSSSGLCSIPNMPSLTPKVGKITPPLTLEVVDRPAGPQAAAALALPVRLDRNMNDAPGDAPVNLGDSRLNVVAFPASQPGNTLILGQGRPPASLMCGNSKLATTTVRRLTPSR